MRRFIAQAIGVLLLSGCFALAGCNSDNVTATPADNGASSGGQSSGGGNGGSQTNSSANCTSTASSTGGGSAGTPSASCTCVAGTTQTSGMTCTATGDGGGAAAVGCAGAGTATVTLGSDGGSITVSCGGFGSTVTITLNDGTGGPTVSVSASSGVPSGIPNFPNAAAGGNTVSGGAAALSAASPTATNKVLLVVALNSASTVQLAGVPAISATVPMGTSVPPGTSVAWYDPVLNTYTDFGNVSVSGQTVTFAGFPMKVALQAQRTYALVLYQKGTSGLASGTVNISGVPSSDDTLLLSVGQSGVWTGNGHLAAVPLYQAARMADAHCTSAAGGLNCSLTGVLAGTPAYFNGGAFAAASGPAAINACFAGSLANPAAGYLLNLDASAGSSCPLSTEGP